ncbi:uncharacterized protein LOC143368894 [Andrena cerasifolii]|uniref:uncharacterized protein LOC143368894 n=1 Tax=Andrena cerasifolii TaxID=2819439 RepID=UPI004037E2FC
MKDTSLSNVDRFHYLRGCLKGEAADLIRNIKPTESNFKHAWTTLQERFQNKRRLVRLQLVRITELQPVKRESSAELKQLYYATWDVVDALADMGRPDPTDWIVHLTVERLDLQSRREWETALGSTTDPPTLEDLKKFIDSRIHSVGALEGRKGERREEEAHGKRTGSKSAQVHQVAAGRNTSKACVLCQGSHYLLFCPRYQEKSQSARRSTLTSLQRCLNCLGKHKLCDCPSNKRCQTCAEKHHTSIHETFHATREATVQQMIPHHGIRRTVILGTARVRAYTPAGQYAVI